MIALGVIVIPSFIVLYGWQSGAPGTEQGPGPVAATIKYGPFDKLEIGPQELQRGRQQLTARMGGYAQQEAYQLDAGVLNRLASSPHAVLDEAINVAILERYAREHGITATLGEAQQILEEQIPPQARQLYLDSLRQQRLTLSDVIHNVRNELLLDKVRRSLGSRVRVTLYEAWLAYSLENMKLTLETARFDVGRFLDKVEVDPEELEKFFQANVSKYRIPEQVQYAFVMVRKDDLRSSVTVTEDELTSAYEGMKEEFRLPRTAWVRDIFLQKPLGEDPGSTAPVEQARQKAQDLYARAAKGEDFASLADQYSELTDVPPREDSGTTATDDATTAGGNLGYISETVARNYFGDDWTSAVFSAEGGKLLPPIETPTGFHVVKVENVREGLLQPLDKVREIVRRRVIDQKVGPLFEEIGQKLADAADRYPSLEQLARETGFELKTTPKVDRDAVFIPQIGLLGDFQAELADLRKGGRSPLLSDETRHLIAEVQEEFPEHDPSLDEVRDRVTADFRQAKARELARAAAEKAAQAKTLEEFQTLAAEAGSTPTQTRPFLASEAATVIGPVQNFLDTAATLKKGDIRLERLGPEDAPLGYLVFHVTEKQDPPKSEFAAAMPNLVNQLVERKQQIVLNEFLRDRREELKDQIALSDFYKD